jgi:hypothetical protein
MVLDWVTARVPQSLFGDTELAQLATLGDRIFRCDRDTGAVVWETQAWESVRSDSHHLSYRVGGRRRRALDAGHTGAGHR